MATLSTLSQQECLLACRSDRQSYRCPSCNRCFTTSSGLNYHRDHNVCSNALVRTNNTNDDLCNITNNNTITDNSTNHNTINNNNTFNINVNFAQGKRNFGEERVDYLTPEFIRECLQDFTQGLGKMVKEVYFNPEYPENHTVRVHSTKQKLMKVTMDGNVSYIPNAAAGRRATTKLGTVLQQHLEPLVELLTHLSKKDYDEDDRDTFESDLKSASYRLQWICENMASKSNKDMTATVDGRGFTKTYNLVAAHLMGMSQAEAAGTLTSMDNQAPANDLYLPPPPPFHDQTWPLEVYPQAPISMTTSRDDASDHCGGEGKTPGQGTYPQPRQTAFGDRNKSNLTRENVAKLTNEFAEIWKAECDSTNGICKSFHHYFSDAGKPDV